MNRPHILYFLSDEHRGQAMSHTGDPNVRTPQMDALAAAGASFRRAYANCPICTPSRGTIFSGRHAHAGPVSGFFDVYKAAGPSTATILREAGYRTAYFGKWHCGIVRSQKAGTNDYQSRGTERTPEHHRAGFEDWRGFEVCNAPFRSFYYRDGEASPTPLEGYQTDAFTDLVIEYLKGYDRPEPLFLVLSVEPPHFPMEVPDSFKRLDPARLEVRPNFQDEPHLREFLAIYYAMIENLDWNIGRLRQALAGLPRFGDTLTVYFSDHGEYAGSHGLAYAKEEGHEESVRIPSIFHWPGRIAAAGLIDGLFSLVDLLPTTLELAGLEIPPHVQGTSFAPALLGRRAGKGTGPREVLLEMVNNPRWDTRLLDWRGLVTDRWKYLFYETGLELLYDLGNDPFEQRDLSGQNVRQCAAMRRRLRRALRQTREPYFDVLLDHGVKPPETYLDIANDQRVIRRTDQRWQR